MKFSLRNNVSDWHMVTMGHFRQIYMGGPIQWIKNHPSEGEATYFLDEGNDPIHLDIVWCFTLPEDAMLFKLSWTEERMKTPNEGQRIIDQWKEINES